MCSPMYNLQHNTMLSPSFTALLAFTSTTTRPLIHADMACGCLANSYSVSNQFSFTKATISTFYLLQLMQRQRTVTSDPSWSFRGGDLWNVGATSNRCGKDFLREESHSQSAYDLQHHFIVDIDTRPLTLPSPTLGRKINGLPIFSQLQYFPKNKTFT